MSDSESFESQTDTEQSTDNEDVVEPQSSVVQPYQFEPVSDTLTNDYMRKTKQAKTVLRRYLRKP
jgi:hypothetical protein